MDDEALAVELVEVRLVGVDGEHRHLGDEVQALAQHVACRGVVGARVERVQAEHPAHHRVHDVAARHPQDPVVDERARHLAHLREVRVELVELRRGGQLAEKEEVRGLLEAVLALGDEAVDEVLDLDAAVEQPPGSGNQLVAFGRGADDVADPRETGEHALAGLVAQAALDVVLRGVEPRVDRALLLCDRDPRVEGQVSASGDSAQSPCLDWLAVSDCAMGFLFACEGPRPAAAWRTPSRFVYIRVPEVARRDR